MAKKSDAIRHPVGFGHAEYWIDRSPHRVYVMWAEGTTLFKIGRTHGSVDDRCKSIAAMSPLPIKVVAEGYGGSARETFLHQQLSAYRHHGEWFDLTSADAIYWLLGQFGDTTEFRQLVDEIDGKAQQVHA